MADAFPDRVAEALEQLQEPSAPRPRSRPTAASSASTPTRRSSPATPTTSSWPRRPGFRPAAPAGRRRRGQEHLHREAGRRGRPRHPQRARRLRGGQEEGLGIVAGTQRRHQAGYLETMKRIHDGAIGDIVAARCYWNQGGLWNKPRQAELDRPRVADAQLALLHLALRRPHLEQHVHNLDVVNWAMGSAPGRARSAWAAARSRTDPGLRPHLRPLRHRLRVPQRRARS